MNPHLRFLHYFRMRVRFLLSSFARAPQSNPLAPRFLANRHHHLSSAPTTTPPAPFLALTPSHIYRGRAGTRSILCQHHKTFHLLRWTSGQRNKSCNRGWRFRHAGSGRAAKLKMNNAFLLQHIDCSDYVWLTDFLCVFITTVLDQTRVPR